MKEEKEMTIDDMISKLDGAAGRLIVAAMKDSVVKEAMQMINEVSIALGDMAADTEYPPTDE